MREAEYKVERHIIGIVESREDAEVGYVSDIRDETGDGPWLEGSMRSGG